MEAGARRVTAAERRARIVRRHRLDGSGSSPEAITAELLALHATDPASVYLSLLARGARLSIAEARAAMYERRTLVRWLAMRRTLFVFPRELVPDVQAAVSTPLAETLRRQLASALVRNGSVPPIRGDARRWILDLERRTARALDARGHAIGAELGADVPRLRTVIPPGAPSESAQTVTSRMLALMSADGRIVRGIPSGAWTTRQHRWEPVAAWFPDGIPRVRSAEARLRLARAWLDAFGPATAEDLEWWTGWTKTATRATLAALDTVEVDLDGAPGVAPAEDVWWERFAADAVPGPGTATLLPALDPTTMGWKRRDWYLAVDRSEIVDRNGNVGPTVWWDGEVVGSWAVGPDGGIRTAIRADRGAEARQAIEAAASALEPRLEGAVVTPVFPTRLELSLRG